MECLSEMLISEQIQLKLTISVITLERLVESLLLDNNRLDERFNPSRPKAMGLAFGNSRTAKSQNRS